MRLSPHRRFLATLPGTDECIRWPWSVDKDGYARLGGERVARIVYVMYHGEILGELTVDHECFNVACVNPRHLRLLPHDENARLQRSALRTHCVNGHEFTPENTIIRSRGGDGRRDCRICQRESTARYDRKKRREKEGGA